MNLQLRDRPGIVVFPPVIPISTIALGFTLQWLVPLGGVARIDQPWRIAIGATVFAAGASLCIIARRSLLRRGTNVNPLQPTTALATEGIFQWTRNPIYVGGTVAMIGIAFAFALDWLLLLIGPSLLVMHFGVVRREEQYLEGKFGEEYRRYKSRVPRYVWSL
jgi:protein-S-isoprenylcysteine O-methyltransferase Ste14